MARTKRKDPEEEKRHREAAIATEQFRQGRDYEWSLAKDFFRNHADGIGSGREAAEALERGEHRR
jgi:hypothetical protein